MQRSSRSSFVASALVIACGLCVGLAGCESLQRKFTRKRKTPLPRPTPIIQFTDYTRTMTPLDRYRKHALMFDYWNDELLDSFTQRPLNPKRVRKASTESLQEFRTMRSLVAEEAAVRFDPLISQRESLDQELQTSEPTPMTVTRVQHTLEAQGRQVDREFSWQDMEDHLKGDAPGS